MEGESNREPEGSGGEGIDGRGRGDEDSEGGRNEGLGDDHTLPSTQP